MRNEEKFRQYQKEYYQKNKEHLKKRYSEYWKKYWKLLKENRPKKICINCGKEFSGRLNKSFCSIKCKEIVRGMKRRKNEEYQEYQKIYQKEWDKNNPEKRKKILERYKRTFKGILNSLKKYQARKEKFGGNIIPNENIIKNIEMRDKVCIYCGHEFTKERKHCKSYDHLNAFMPHSEINTVLACQSCNASKGDKPVLKWLEEKKLKPSPIIIDLLKRQENDDDNKINEMIEYIEE